MNFQLHMGQVKWFDAKEGYGFISPRNGGKRTVTDERHLVANRGGRKLSSCAPARMGAECQGMGLRDAGTGLAL